VVRPSGSSSSLTHPRRYQGESDATDAECAAAYGTALPAWLAAARAGLGAPDLPAVLVAPTVCGGRLGDTAKAGLPAVRAAVFEVAAATPHTVAVDARGLALQPDGMHLTRHGQIALGARIGAALGGRAAATTAVPAAVDLFAAAAAADGGAPPATAPLFRPSRPYSNFTYGEVSVATFLDAMAVVGPRGGEAFADLGCGSGKIVVGAALAFPALASVTGVDLRSTCLADAKALCAAAGVGGAGGGPALTIARADFVADGGSGGAPDIMYACATCFDDVTVAAVCAAASSGRALVLVDKEAPAAAWAETARLQGVADWGPCSVFVYDRRRAGRAFEFET